MGDFIVTGGLGFIGSSVVESLSNKYPNSTIYVVDTCSISFTRLKQKFNRSNIKVLQSSMIDIPAEILETVTHIWHLAAHISVSSSIKDPVYDADINIIQFLKFIQMVKTKKDLSKITVIFSSSGGALYSPSVNSVIESDVSPYSPYGCSKLAVENYLATYSKLFGLKYTILRYSNVYGFRQLFSASPGVIGWLLKSLYLNREFVVNNGGVSTRDYVYIDDVVFINSHPTIMSGLNTAINVSTNSRISVIGVVEVFNLLLEEILPGHRIMYTLSPELVLESRDSILCNDLMYSLIGWKPSVNIVHGISNILNLYRDFIGA